MLKFLVLFFAASFSHASDPCHSMVEKSKMEVVREISADEFESVRPGRHARFGRFFRAKSNANKSYVLWTIPYAHGKACVIRDVSKL